MFYGNLSQLGKKSNSVIRSRSVIGSKIGVMPDQWRVSLSLDYKMIQKVFKNREGDVLFFIIENVILFRIDHVIVARVIIP